MTWFAANGKLFKKIICNILDMCVTLSRSVMLAGHPESTSHLLGTCLEFLVAFFLFFKKQCVSVCACVHLCVCLSVSLCVCAWMHVWVCTVMCVPWHSYEHIGSEDNLKGSVSPSAMCVLGIELRSSHLEANTSVFWAISLAQDRLLPVPSPFHHIRPRLEHTHMVAQETHWWETFFSILTAHIANVSRFLP